MVVEPGGRAVAGLGDGVVVGPGGAAVVVGGSVVVVGGAAVVLVVGRVVVGRVVVGRVVVVPPVDGPVVAVEGVVVEVEVLTPVGPVLEGGDGVTPPASTGAKKADAPKRLMAVPRAANPRER